MQRLLLLHTLYVQVHTHTHSLSTASDATVAATIATTAVLLLDERAVSFVPIFNS